MHPAPNGLPIPIQPLRDLWTALAIQQQQNAVIALAQPGIVRPAKSVPHLIASDGSVRDLQHFQALHLLTFQSVIPWGLKNWDYFLGSL
jgi:hypothetical protein